MGLRAYFLVDTVHEMPQREFVRAVREIASVPWVDFVDPVIGPPDLVVMVDAPITVEALANKIKAKPWVKDLRVLRLVSIFERHRTIQVSKAPIMELGAGLPDAEAAPDLQSASIYDLLNISGEVTGSRAYFLVDPVENIGQRQFIEAVREIEETPGVDFVDPVIGPPDLVVMVDAPTTVEALASEIKAKPWVKDLRVLRLVSVLERQKAIKVSKTPIFEAPSADRADLERAWAPKSVSIHELLRRAMPPA